MQRISESLILSVKAHGENGFLVRLFSAEHGKLAGLVRGGRKQAALLQPMATVQAQHTRRLAHQLGNLKVEGVAAVPAVCFGCGERLNVLTEMARLLDQTLADDEPHERLYERTQAMLAGLAAEDFLTRYAFWQLDLLKELGYGLSLTVEEAVPCPEGTPLMYVSPKSGRAVSQHVGAAYAEKLLRLPRLFGGVGEVCPQADLAAAFRLTGYFLKQISLT